MAIWLTKWEDMNPIHAARVLCGLATLEHHNVKVVIPNNGGKRTDNQQIALYVQGRQPLDVVNAKRKLAGWGALDPDDNTYTVTDDDGVKNKSKHQLGLATDICPDNGKGQPCWPPQDDPRWKVIHDAMTDQGLISGLDWIDFPDPSHYESKGV